MGINPGNGGRGWKPHPKIQNGSGGRPGSSGRSAFQLSLGLGRAALLSAGRGWRWQCWAGGPSAAPTASSLWPRTRPLETKASAPLSQPRRDSCVRSPSICLPSDSDSHLSSKNANPVLKERPPLGTFSDRTSPGSRVLSARLYHDSAPLLGLRPQPVLRPASTGGIRAFSPTKRGGPLQLRLLPKLCPLP